MILFNFADVQVLSNYINIVISRRHLNTAIKGASTELPS